MEVERSRATGWVGWMLFGGMMLVMLGSAHACVGALAIFRPELLAGTRPDVLFGLSLTVLAWAHLLLGAGSVVTGVALIRGLRWARFVAIALAWLAMLVGFVLAPVHPVFATVIVVFSALILYATAVHGDELHDAYT